MKITVKDCLSLEAFSQCIIAAGKRNLENRVRSISVMDADNVSEAIKHNGIKDQLVLTSFYGFKDQPHLQRNIIVELSKQSIGAIVLFNAEKGLSSVEDVVIETAEQVGLPLLVIPSVAGIEYSHAIEQVMDKLLYGDNFKNSLINNTIYHLLNFEKHSNFQSAIREAAISNDFQIVLLSEDFNPILSVETRQKTTIAEAIRLGKDRDVEKSPIYTLIDVNGVLTYWGPVTINKEKYFLFIVDNEDNYSAGEITKLAEIIELAMGMWKYTPERDAKAELIKALIRGNKSLAYSLKDETDIKGEEIVSVFYAKGIENNQGNKVISDFETRENLEIMRIAEGEETYGIILKSDLKAGSEEPNEKAICLNLYDKLKEDSKTVRIFHATGIDGIEGAADSFRLISETWTFVENVFPYKRVFTKYELALVSNCINLQVQGGYLKKNYMDLLEPFKKEMGENKARQLLETLETFVLDAGMNSGKTSEFMGIHTNTVQYRLKRINDVLGAEITGNRVIPGLTMALALKRLERVVK